jgi:hypothetical protein
MLTLATNRAMTEEPMLPIDGQTVAILWNDLKTMYRREDACKAYARQQVDDDQPRSAEWALVIEILEGRMEWHDDAH